MAIEGQERGEAGRFTANGAKERDSRLVAKVRHEIVAELQARAGKRGISVAAVADEVLWGALFRGDDRCDGDLEQILQSRAEPDVLRPEREGSMNVEAEPAPPDAELTSLRDLRATYRDAREQARHNAWEIAATWKPRAPWDQ